MTRVARGELLDAESLAAGSSTYLDKDPTPAARSRAGSRSSALWAGKSGTMSGVRNDSGILRTKKGRFVLVVFTDGSKAAGLGAGPPRRARDRGRRPGDRGRLERGAAGHRGEAGVTADAERSRLAGRGPRPLATGAWDDRRADRLRAHEAFRRPGRPRHRRLARHRRGDRAAPRRRGRARCSPPRARRRRWRASSRRSRRPAARPRPLALDLADSASIEAGGRRRRSRRTARSRRPRQQRRRHRGQPHPADEPRGLGPRARDEPDRASSC